ncbi:MAG: hypothetical protein ACRC2B_21370, partial [Rubrivivax sp.]
MRHERLGLAAVWAAFAHEQLDATGIGRPGGAGVRRAEAEHDGQQQPSQHAGADQAGIHGRLQVGVGRPSIHRKSIHSEEAKSDGAQRLLQVFEQIIDVLD